jgi:hypothetical protein
MKQSRREALRKSEQENLAIRVQKLLQPTNVTHIHTKPKVIDEARRKILEMRQIRAIDPPEKRFAY